MLDHLFRDAIVTLSSFSIGSALFAAVLSLRMFNSNRRRYSSFAAAKVGYALVVGTVLVRIVLPNPSIPLDGYGAFYLGGLALAGIGFVGVGRAIRREFVEWEAARLERKREEDEASGNA